MNTYVSYPLVVVVCAGHIDNTSLTGHVGRSYQQIQ